MNSFAPDSYPQNQMASRENNRLQKTIVSVPIGSMYAIYGNIYHQYTPNVSILPCTDPMGFDEPKHDAVFPDLIESNLGVSRLGWQKGSRTCRIRRYPKVLCGFMPFHNFKPFLTHWLKIWVCLKIGYIPNYSHLIGIMIINHGFRGTLFSDTPIYQSFHNQGLLDEQMVDGDSPWPTEKNMKKPHGIQVMKIRKKFKGHESWETINKNGILSGHQKWDSFGNFTNQNGDSLWQSSSLLWRMAIFWPSRRFIYQC